MGGCASSPKGIDLKKEENASTEVPVSPEKKPEVDSVNVAQEGGENESAQEKEEPLVDISEPTEEKVEEAKPEEANVEAESESEAAAETQEPAVLVEEAKPEAVASSEDKSDEPLVPL